MKNILLLIVLLIFGIYASYSQDNKVKTLKDSLLEHYTMEELKAMSFDELDNAKRITRGQEPIDYTVKKPTHDFFGVFIIDSINKPLALETINNRVELINKEKSNYRQEVYPNSYSDVLEGFFGGFYKTIVSYELTYPNYKTFTSDENWNDGELEYYCNATRRVYYYSTSGELRLIETLYALGINEGETHPYYDSEPYEFTGKAYYVWDDTIQKIEIMEGEQNFRRNLFWEPATEEELDSMPVECEYKEIYFYKENSFLEIQSSGKFDKFEWKEKLMGVEKRDAGDGSNSYVVIFKKLMKEYKEKKQNDYLKPVDCSYLQPYIIEPE